MNNSINDSFTLKRDTAKEQSAISKIVEYYLDEENSNKTPNQMMSLLLDTIIASASTVPINQKNVESENLVAFNQFIKKHADNYRNNNPTIPLLSEELDSAIEALQEINKTVGDNYINKRLNMFISKLDSLRIETLNSINSRSRWQRIGFIFFAAAFFLLVISSLTDLSLVNISIVCSAIGFTLMVIPRLL